MTKVRTTKSNSAPATDTILKEEVAEHYDDFRHDDPELETILQIFEPDELSLHSHYKGGWHLRWNRENKPDQNVWFLSPREGSMPKFAKTLFEEIGIEVR